MRGLSIIPEKQYVPGNYVVLCFPSSFWRQIFRGVAGRSRDIHRWTMCNLCFVWRLHTARLLLLLFLLRYLDISIASFSCSWSCLYFGSKTFWNVALFTYVVIILIYTGSRSRVYTCRYSEDIKNTSFVTCPRVFSILRSNGNYVILLIVVASSDSVSS